MTKIVLFVACIALAPLELQSQEYCSLTVRILTPKGQRPEVSVSVVERNGRISTQTQESADVRFCDLGALPVTVKIGEDGTCNQTIVRDVPVAWNDPYQLRVLYDPEPCLRDLPRAPVPTCRVVFRVSDTQGNWLNHQVLDVSSPHAARLYTDRFGRASFVVKQGDTVAGSVGELDKSARFNFTCTTAEPIHEDYLRLGR